MTGQRGETRPAMPVALELLTSEGATSKRCLDTTAVPNLLHVDWSSDRARLCSRYTSVLPFSQEAHLRTYRGAKHESSDFQVSNAR
jgi:hypothetical protein